MMQRHNSNPLLRTSRLRNVLLGTALAVAGVLNAQAPNTYSYLTGTTGPNAVMADMTGATNLITAFSDDGAGALTGIGFSFVFNGVTHTQFSANVNGCLRLGALTTTGPTYYFNSLANANGGSPTIMPYWDDLHTGGAGNGGYVRYVLLNSGAYAAPNRRLVVEWFVTVPYAGSGVPNARFQCWLDETTSAITFVHGTGTAANTAGYSIAINAATSLYSSVDGATHAVSTTTFTNTASAAIAAGRWYRFDPPVPCTTLGTLAGGTTTGTVTSGCGQVTSTLSVTGGTTGASGLTYQWRSGPPGGPYTTLLGTAATQVVTALGTTTAYVRDIICSGGPTTATSTEQVITVTPSPVVSASAAPPGPFCYQANTVLTASGADSYSWSPTYELSDPNSATPTCTSGAPLTYTVTGTTNGCTGTASVAIAINPAPLITSISATPSLVCEGGNSNLQVNAVSSMNFTSTNNTGGSITINASGNASQYPSTVNVSGVGVVTEVRVTLTHLSHTYPKDIDMVLFGPTGAHSILFTDAMGTDPIVNGIYTFRVGGAPLPIDAAPTFLGQYDVINGGAWSGSGTPSAVTNTDLGVFAGTDPNGAWRLYIFDDTGGDAGSLVNWQMELIQTSPITSYSWSPSTYLSDPNIPNPVATGVVTPVTYTVTVTNAIGCTATGNVSVTPSGPISAASISGNLGYCTGGSTTLTAVPTDGGEPFMYLWSPGGETSESITVSAVGNYSCQVDDACGGSANTGVVSVVEYANPTPTITVDGGLPSCGSAVLLSSEAIGNVWSPGGATTQSIEASISADYSVTVTDVNGCVGTSAAESITVTPGPSNVMANASDLTVCSGALVDLTSSADFSGSLSILTENFNAGIGNWTQVNSTTGGSDPAAAAWAVRGGAFPPAEWDLPILSWDNSGYMFTDGDAAGSGSQTNTELISPSMDLSGLTSASLNFSHYYRDGNATADQGMVDVSVNGGAWTTVQTYTTTQGDPSGFADGTISLNAFIGETDVRIRFHYVSTGWWWGWAVDNVSVTGTPPIAFSWTSVPADFTSGLQNPTDVVVASVPTTYTVTASANGCDVTASVTVDIDPTDTDNDGTVDCVDGCPNDPLKTAPGACGCGVPDTDSDGDGIADCADDCDLAVDGIANFDENTCACLQGYYATLTDIVGTDVITACTICPAGYFCADGIAAAPCPAGRFQDQQGQTQCLDCAAGTFNAAVAQTSCTACPAGTASNVTGAQECPLCPANTYNPDEGQTTCTACPNGESSGPGATECTPNAGCTTDLNLVFQTDGVTNIGWEIRQQGSNILVQSGGGVYPQSLGYGISTCVPDGCYYLVVTSDLGGIVQNSVQGGYTLSTLSGDRLIDNRNNFLSGTTSQISGGEGFCFPMATTPRVIYTSCDKLDWNVGPCDGSAPSQYKSEFIVADINAAVSGDYPNAQSGFTFWFYNPNGNYNFRRFRSHVQGEGAPVAAADRYTHCLLNNWAAANALLQNTLYNVRVRAVVNNVPGEFGPACRMMLDQVAAQCPVTKLMDVPGNPQLSCGQSRDWGNGNYVYARPVWRYNNNCVKVNANRYRFHFFITGEPYDVTVTSNTYARQLNWGAGAGGSLEAGVTYEVTVEASFDNGSTYCPAGDICLLTITLPGGLQGGGNQHIMLDNSTGLGMYPNPNRGDQLYLAFAAVEEGIHTVSVDIYDLFGKRVSARKIAVADGFINTVLDLDEMAAGMYLVNITAGETVYTERLVIQP